MSKAAVKAVKKTPKKPGSINKKIVGGGGNGVGTSYGFGSVSGVKSQPKLQVLVGKAATGISKTDKVEIFPYDVTELDQADNVKKRREFGWRVIARNGKNLGGNKGFNTAALARKGAVRLLGEGARAIMVDVKDA